MSGFSVAANKQRKAKDKSRWQKLSREITRIDISKNVDPWHKEERIDSIWRNEYRELTPLLKLVKDALPRN